MEAMPPGTTASPEILGTWSASVGPYDDDGAATTANAAQSTNACCETARSAPASKKLRL